MQYSQTQLSNIMTAAGILTMVFAKFGLDVDQSTLAFVIGAIFSVGFTAYNYYQRYKKGDITLGGFKKW